MKTKTGDEGMKTKETNGHDNNDEKFMDPICVCQLHIMN